MNKKKLVCFIVGLLVVLFVIFVTFYVIMQKSASRSGMKKVKIIPYIIHCVKFKLDSDYRIRYEKEETKRRISYLKSALLAYASDVGKMPYIGNNSDIKSAYDQDLLLNSEVSDKNVLLSNNNQYIKIDNYEKKWKGPYIEDLSESMVDYWGTPIKYVPDQKNIYLWSYGPNKKPDFKDADDAFHKMTHKGSDDIVVSVMRNEEYFRD